MRAAEEIPIKAKSSPMPMYQLCIYLPFSKVQYLVATSFRGMAPNIFASVCFALATITSVTTTVTKTTCMLHIFVAALLLLNGLRRDVGQSREDRLKLFSLPRICFVYVFWFGCFYVLIMRLIRFFEADNGQKVAGPGRWQRSRRLPKRGQAGAMSALLRF